MGLVQLGKYITPSNVSMVQGLIDEFSRNPRLVQLLHRFTGLDAKQAYGELMCLDDQDLMALAQAIGKINAKGKVKK